MNKKMKYPEKAILMLLIMMVAFLYSCKPKYIDAPVEVTEIDTVNGPPVLIEPEIKVGAYYFDGWTGLTNSMHLPPKLINDFPEREPIWGWITSTQPIIDEQIIDAADAGLSYFTFCWFYSGEPSYLNNPRNSAIQKFKTSSEKHRMKYNIMVTNHVPHTITAAQWPELIPIWVQEFKDPNYLRMDGKPVISFFDYWSLITTFGNSANVKTAIDALRTAAAAEGINAIRVGFCVNNSADIDMLKRCGADYVTQYNNGSVGFQTGIQATPIANLLAAEPIKRNEFTNKESLDYVATATLGWDTRPWANSTNNFDTAPYYTGFSSNSVRESVKEVVNWVRSHAAEQATVEQMAILYAWNEYGEGGYLTPCKLGLNPLVGLKEALVTGSSGQPQPTIKRVVILGNSLVSHGPNSSIGWSGNWGMAASAQDSDFVHLLIKNVQLKDPSVTFQFANIATFESNYDTYDLSQLAKYRYADMLILKLSENVNGSTAVQRDFKTHYDRLVKYLAPSSSTTKIIVDGFWPSPVNDIVHTYATEHNLPLVVINDLYTSDPTNTAQGLFTNSGVARHPSDKGMRNIAIRIWNAIASYFPS